MPPTTSSINHWNMFVTLCNPNSIDKNLEEPKGMVTTVLGIFTRFTEIWWYAHTRSILEKIMYPCRAEGKRLSVRGGDGIEASEASYKTKISISFASHGHGLIYGQIRLGWNMCSNSAQAALSLSSVNQCRRGKAGGPFVERKCLMK